MSLPVSVPVAPAGTRIPRLLHQVYFRPGDPGAELPPPLRANVDRLVRDNPGWRHRLYDMAAMEAFVGDRYGARMLELFRRIDPAYGAARADFFRYLLVYAEGGVYLDVKSRFAGPVDRFLSGDEGFVASRWRNRPGEVHENWGLHPETAGYPGGELQQWHVIAAPGHPFLRAVVERVAGNVARYRPRRDGTGWIGVLRLTGPIAYTRAIHPLLDHYPRTVIADETAIGLEYSTVGGAAHQQLFGSHYTELTGPVVRQPGLAGLAARGYVAARRLRHRLVPRA